MWNNGNVVSFCAGALLAVASLAVIRIAMGRERFWKRVRYRYAIAFRVLLAFSMVSMFFMAGIAEGVLGHPIVVQIYPMWALAWSVAVVNAFVLSRLA